MIPADILAAHLATITAQDPTTGATDRARHRRCPQCRQPVIVGLDNDVAAFTAMADPTPLTAESELTALLTDRDTYRLHVAPKLQLRRRDKWQITGQRPDAVIVLPAHRCGQPLAPIPAPADDRSHTDGPQF